MELEELEPLEGSEEREELETLEGLRVSHIHLQSAMLLYFTEGGEVGRSLSVASLVRVVRARVGKDCDVVWVFVVVGLSRVEKVRARVVSVSVVRRTRRRIIGNK